MCHGFLRKHPEHNKKIKRYSESLEKCKQQCIIIKKVLDVLVTEEIIHRELQGTTVKKILYK